MGSFAWRRRGECSTLTIWHWVCLFFIQAEIRKEFAKLDTDSSGFITKGNALKTQNIFPTNLFFRGNGGNNCLRIHWRQGLANLNIFFVLLFMFSLLVVRSPGCYWQAWCWQRWESVLSWVHPGYEVQKVKIYENIILNIYLTSTVFIIFSEYTI